jgi:hypothetical protein
MSATMNRRAALGAIASVATLAVPAVAIAAPLDGPDPVFAAIDRHKAALAAYAEERERSEELSDVGYTWDDANRLCAANKAEIDALMQVADTIPTTELGANAALAHLCREGDEGRYGALFEVFAQSLIAAKWAMETGQ